MRQLDGASVAHTPIPENQSHSEVFGVDDNEARVKLRRLSEIEIRPEDPVEN